MWLSTGIQSQMACNNNTIQNSSGADFEELIARSWGTLYIIRHHVLFVCLFFVFRIVVISQLLTLFNRNFFHNHKCPQVRLMKPVLKDWESEQLDDESLQQSLSSTASLQRRLKQKLQTGIASSPTSGPQKLLHGGEALHYTEGACNKTPLIIYLGWLS